MGDEIHPRDVEFMRVALEEARLGLAEGEIPIGCVVVHNETVISRAHNTRHRSRSKIAHAEMNAIQSAVSFLYEHRFACDLYVSLEPCLMCHGAIVCCRFRRLIFGAADKMVGCSTHALGSHYYDFGPKIMGNVLADDSAALLKLYLGRTNQNWGDKYFDAASASLNSSCAGE